MKHCFLEQQAYAYMRVYAIMAFSVTLDSTVQNSERELGPNCNQLYYRVNRSGSHTHVCVSTSNLTQIRTIRPAAPLTSLHACVTLSVSTRCLQRIHQTSSSAGRTGRGVCHNRVDRGACPHIFALRHICFVAQIPVVKYM